MKDPKLKGWNFIVYIMIRNNYKNRPFSLNDLYGYETYFSHVYPANYNIRPKLRQTLQHLRDKGLLLFHSKGHYQLAEEVVFESQVKGYHQELVYLLSNDSIPGWVKIGRTNAIGRRLKELYNTSVPLPFKIEETITTNTCDESRILEKSIHSIIDTINPSIRKHTEANKREFFKMSPDEGKSIFKLVTQIINITPTQNSVMSV